MGRFFSALAPIAGALIGNMILPGVGTAIGGALGGLGGAAVGGGNLFRGAAMGGLGGLAGWGLSSLGEGAAGLGTAGGAGATAGTDPIETIWQSMQATGAPTASAAASQLGYGSVQEMVNAANPLMSGAGTQIAGAGAPGTGATGVPTIGSMTGRLGSLLPQSISGIQVNPGLASVLNTMQSSGLGPVGQVLGAGSGIMGIMNAMEMQRLAREASQRTPSSQAAESRMQALINNPSLITQMPDFAAGSEAVQRSMAAQGYTGSGNMASALQAYGGRFYNQQMQELANVAGTGAPQFGTAIAGLGQGSTAMGGGLASLGYTAARGGF